MLNKIFLTLAVLILFAVTQNSYSQYYQNPHYYARSVEAYMFYNNNYADLPVADYKADNYSVMALESTGDYRSYYLDAGGSYGSSATRAEAVILTADVTGGSVIVPRYIARRTWDKSTVTTVVTEPDYSLPLIEPVPVSDKTYIMVAPHGYVTHTDKLVSTRPIRDFRADYWQTKYYRDEFHNQSSYNETYKYNNIYNTGRFSEND